MASEGFVAAGYTVSSIHRSGDLPEGVNSAIADITDTDAVNAAFDTVFPQAATTRARARRAISRTLKAGRERVDGRVGE